MFTFYRTYTEYFSLDEDELQNLHDDYKEYCNNNKLDFTDEDNFLILILQDGLMILLIQIK